MAFYSMKMFLPIIALMLVFTRVVMLEDVIEVTENPKDEGERDCVAENSIKEMLVKLEAVVAPRGYCSNKEGTEPPKPCIDLTSTQSVLTQLCDRLLTIETKVNGLASKVSLLTNPNHNSNGEDSDKPFTQIAKLKEELKQLKRSAAFYASRKDTVGNFTHERIMNFNTTVNSGTYFDSVNGIFYAPFEGIYHFSLSYQKPPEVNLEACLVVDKDVIASTSNERQSKIDILTSLSPGQAVWTDRISNSIPTDTEVSFVFSGYLVH